MKNEITKKLAELEADRERLRQNQKAAGRLMIKIARACGVASEEYRAARMEFAEAKSLNVAKTPKINQDIKMLKFINQMLYKTKKWLRHFFV